MPITVRDHTVLSSDEQQAQIKQLYDTSPEFGDGIDAVAQLKTALQRGDKFYTAEFNDKIIAAIWSRGQGDTRKLQYVVTHPANRGRGVAAILIKALCDRESANGVLHFEPGCGAIHRVLAALHRSREQEAPVATH